MRKLTPEEAEALPTKTLGKQSLAREYITRMEVGDIILLEQNEWHQKHSGPNELIRRMMRKSKRNYTIEKMLDGSGWVIRRLKDFDRRR